MVSLKEDVIRETQNITHSRAYGLDNNKDILPSKAHLKQNLLPIA